MVRGARDFGTVAARTLTTPVLDLGELAVRLGSPISFDRQGTVLAFLQGDAIQGRLRSIFGSGARIDAIAGEGFTSGYAWRTFSNVDGDSAYMLLQIPYIGDAPSGVEAVFRLGTGTGFRFDVIVVLDDADGGHQGQVSFDSSTGNVRYINGAGNLTDTPTQPTVIRTPTWQYVKVVSDPADNTYVRALWNGEDLGLAGIAAYTFVTTARQLGAQVGIDALSSVSNEAWIDSVAITVNED